MVNWGEMPPRRFLSLSKKDGDGIFALLPYKNNARTATGDSCQNCGRDAEEVSAIRYYRDGQRICEICFKEKS